MNILYLSDIHFGRENPKYGIKDNFEDREKILSGIIEKCKNIEDALKPQHVIFTGDIAWHAKKEEFDDALIWFKELLSALSLSGKDISFCVGNHDVDWAYDCLDEKIDDYSIERIDELYKYENINIMDASIYRFNSFCHELGVEPYKFPVGNEIRYSYSVGYKDVVLNKSTVRIVAFNTSMLSSVRTISEDKTWIGKPQLDSLISRNILSPSGKNKYYTIALFHHSERFLHPNETATYDNREATYLKLSSCVDLMLSGHTESSGRPSFTKQRGGAYSIIGGSAYYSDNHLNIFSLLYIQSKKKTIAMMPFIYENGWKDFEFINYSPVSEFVKGMPEEGQSFDNTMLYLKSDNEEFAIRTGAVNVFHTRKASVLNNKRSFINSFDIVYDDISRTLNIYPKANRRRYIRTLLDYYELTEFINNHKGKNICARLMGEDEKFILNTDRVNVNEYAKYDIQFLKKLSKLEEHFSIKFTLPDEISDFDYKKVDFIYELISKGYMDLTFPEGAEYENIAHEASFEEMKYIYEGSEKNSFALKNEYSNSVVLFGVNMQFDSINGYLYPYYVNMKRLERKIKSFEDGDRRKIIFCPAGSNKVTIVYDKNKEERFLKTISDYDIVNVNFDFIEIVKKLYDATKNS